MAQQTAEQHQIAVAGHIKDEGGSQRAEVDAREQFLLRVRR